MNTENNKGLYPHNIARQLYKSGKMPYWAYVQLYATKEEAIEIYEERRKQIIDNINRQKEEQREKEEQKKAEEQFFKDAEKKISKDIENALSDLLKPFTK